MKAAFHKVQQVSLRLYNYPQKTNKQSFYSYQDILYRFMDKLIGTKDLNSAIRKMYSGYDDIHGEYLEVRGRKLTNKGQKDRVIWINARG
jgi:hypothetical protein